MKIPEFSTATATMFIVVLQRHAEGDTAYLNYNKTVRVNIINHLCGQSHPKGRQINKLHHPKH